MSLSMSNDISLNVGSITTITKHTIFVTLVNTLRLLCQVFRSSNICLMLKRLFLLGGHRETYRKINP